jgi:hypothetical protein
MEPEGSLPQSQLPANCLYHEPAQSSPYPHIPHLKIHLNIILSFTLEFPQWPLFLRFPHQNPVHTSPLPHLSYMPCPSHSSRFYQLHDNGWGLRIMKLLIMKFSPLPCYLSHLGPNILLNTLFSNTLSVHSSLNVSNQVSHSYKITGTLVVEITNTMHWFVPLLYSIYGSYMLQQ